MKPTDAVPQPPLTPPDLAAAYEAHRADQIRHLARTTTPEQRINWLGEMIRMFPEAHRAEAKRRGDRLFAQWHATSQLALASPKLPASDI